LGCNATRSERERGRKRAEERSDAASAECGGWSRVCVFGERGREANANRGQRGRGWQQRQRERESQQLWLPGNRGEPNTVWQRGIPHSASEDVRSFTLSRGAAIRRELPATSVS